jgi:hypothetical protein
MSKKKATKRSASEPKPLDVTLPVYQVKIALEAIDPPIWRRIEVSDCNLNDLHEIIQVSFGWSGFHRHVFQVRGLQRRGMRGHEYHDLEDTDAIFLSDLAELGCRVFRYEYDFGDCWLHEITLEATLPAEPGVCYPRCVDGRRSGPPEDTGGPYAYPAVLQSLEEARRDDEEFGIPGLIPPDFDPEHFDLDDLNLELFDLRDELGCFPSKHLPPVAFQEGELVRVKPGGLHPAYPDIPLGGWTGSIVGVIYLIPTGYIVRWSGATLDAVHPVYFQRCQRDERDAEYMAIEECLIEPAAEDDPTRIESPTEIRTEPLSPDKGEDRIRMVFGLTSNDPLPDLTPDTLRIYDQHLRAHLQFPMKAHAWIDERLSKNELIFTELAAFDPAGEPELFCEVQAGQPECELSQLRLAAIQPDADHPNHHLLDDYCEWYWRCLDRMEEGLEDEHDDGFDDDEAGLDFAERIAAAGDAASHPYPFGTVAFYGPDDQHTTKIAAGVFLDPDSEVIIERWVGTDVKDNPKTQREIIAFFDRYGVRRVGMSDGNMGCPHEEGEDFPRGEDCPFCPWWKGKQGTARRD